MHAVIDDFIPVYLARITQLTNKSNQFNVTTRRYTPAEMESVFEDDGYIRLYGKLIDKFGDNGVVSIVIGRKNGTALDIDLWLMSCRVLKRDMEFAMLDRLVERCREVGVETINGYYYPPQKTRWSATFSVASASRRLRSTRTAAPCGSCASRTISRRTT